MKLFVTFIRKFGVPFLLIGTFLFLSMQAGFAQTGTEVGVFEDREIRPGAIVEVPVDIRDVTDLYAFDIEISFDPEYLDFDDADPNKAGIQTGIGTFLDPGMMLMNQIDPEEGTIHVVMTQINPSQPKSGSGNLLVLYLTGLKTGLTTLEVTKVELSTRYGEAIAVSGVDAGIVIAAQAPVVTATSIPVVDPIQITEIPTLDPSKIPPTPTTAPSATPIPTRTATSMATQTRTATATGQTAQARTTTATNVPTRTATLAPGATLAPMATQGQAATQSAQSTSVSEIEAMGTATAEPTAVSEVVNTLLVPTETVSSEGRELAKDSALSFGKVLPWLIGAVVLLIIPAGVYLRIRKNRAISEEDK